MKPTAEIVATYNKMHANVDSMGKSLLKLMRHPDATPEQINDARQMYFSVYQSWIEARMTLRERFQPKPHTFQRPLPWNNPIE